MADGFREAAGCSAAFQALKDDIPETITEVLFACGGLLWGLQNTWKEGRKVPGWRGWGEIGGKWSFAPFPTQDTWMD